MQQRFLVQIQVKIAEEAKVDVPACDSGAENSGLRSSSLPIRTLYNSQSSELQLKVTTTEREREKERAPKAVVAEEPRQTAYREVEEQCCDQESPAGEPERGLPPQRIFLENA
jgi:hypothetical protein